MRYHELFGLLDDTFAKYRKEECSPDSKWTPYCYYKNLDEDDKYRKLWKYIVGTHGSKFSQSEDLEDICRTLAHEDDENF